MAPVPARAHPGKVRAVTWLPTSVRAILSPMARPKSPSPRPPGRPPLPPGVRRVFVGFRFDPATKARLDELAAEGECTRTEVVERLIWGEGAERNGVT